MPTQQQTKLSNWRTLKAKGAAAGAAVGAIGGKTGKGAVPEP